MRFLLALLAGLAVAQMAAAREFVVGRENRALIIIGVAEQANAAEPAYSLLWRRIADDGTFGDWDEDLAFEARTSDNDTVRVRGVPGEFTIVEAAPGTYALDSVYGEIEERGVRYFANGAIIGPSRPSFEVAAGEAVFLGVWVAQLDPTGAIATASLWRLEAGDALAAVASGDIVEGQVRLRETHVRDVPCAPRRMGIARREICGVAEPAPE